MTFNLIEVLVLLMTIVLGIGVTVFVRLAARMNRAADEVVQTARRVTELTPGVKGLVEDAEAVTKKLRALTETTSGIADNIHAITASASEVTTRLTQGLDGQMSGYRAAIVGARAGLEALRHGRRDNGSQGNERSEIEREAERVGH